MTFSDTAMMELGITQSTNIHNTRSLIRTLKYALDILQTEEAFTVEEYKDTHMRSANNLKFLVGTKKSDGTPIIVITQENAIKKNFCKRFTVPSDFDFFKHPGCR